MPRLESLTVVGVVLGNDGGASLWSACGPLPQETIRVSRLFSCAEKPDSRRNHPRVGRR